jgi:hypothetical protein
MVPSPCPSALDVNVIQLTGLAARHAHSRATLTVSVPDPPAAGWLAGDAATVASQRFVAGDVIVVDVLAELPHPAAPSAMNNSRGARDVTALPLHNFRQCRHRSHGTRWGAWYHFDLQRNTH